MLSVEIAPKNNHYYYYLIQHVGCDALHGAVGLAASGAGGAALGQQHAVKQQDHSLQLTGYVHILVHAEHLWMLGRRQRLLGGREERTQTKLREVHTVSHTQLYLSVQQKQHSHRHTHTLKLYTHIRVVHNHISE